MHLSQRLMSVRSSQVTSVNVSATFTVGGVQVTGLAWSFREMLLPAVRRRPCLRCLGRSRLMHTPLFLPRCVPARALLM